MSKENNLTDFLTDVADAIREKKGTTEKINPQDFSDEIKGIKTSTSIWTGHADVEGLKAIGWTDDDIAYYQEHGVNWNEEDDEYHKVSDDNKALYGVVTLSNARDYKDSLVYLPKIDMGRTSSLNHRFVDCSRMIAIPFIFTNTISEAASAFSGCHSLTCVYPMDLTHCEVTSATFSNCLALTNVPSIKIQTSTSLAYMFEGCRSLETINISASNPTNLEYSFYVCNSLKKVVINSDTSEVKNFRYMFYNDYSLVSVDSILDLISATNVSSMFTNCICLCGIKIKNLPISISFKDSLLLFKESILYIIENEVAIEPITITLHAKAYTRLAEDPDIVSALANHPNVSLASA